jgi:hypothetical protein
MVRLIGLSRCHAENLMETFRLWIHLYIHFSSWQLSDLFLAIYAYMMGQATISTNASTITGRFTGKACTPIADLACIPTS